MSWNAASSGLTRSARTIARSLGWAARHPPSGAVTARPAGDGSLGVQGAGRPGGVHSLQRCLDVLSELVQLPQARPFAMPVRPLPRPRPADPFPSL